MKKIKTMRISGHPIELEDIKAYNEEWKTLFDKAMDKCKVKDSEVPDMLRLQKLLAKLEGVLGRKYDRVTEWDFLKTKKAWEVRMEEFGNIMVTKAADTGEMIYVIMDEDM